MIIQKKIFIRALKSNILFSTLAIFLAMLPLLAFKDRLNYLSYAENSLGILLFNLTSGLDSLIFNEPIWLTINILLSQFFESEIIVQIIIVLPLIIISNKIISNTDHKILAVLLIMLVPQVLKNHIVHLRQGVALCVFIIGFYSNKLWIRNILQVLSCFIHSSFFIVFFIRLFDHFWGKLKINLYLKMIITAIMLFLIGTLAIQIASVLGARQGERYTAVLTNVSGLGFVFWSMIYVIFLSAGRRFLHKNSFQMSIFSFYLVNYFTFPVAARVFESGLLLILLAGLDLRGYRRLMFISFVVAFSALGLVLKIDQPLLGWGASE